MKWLCWKIWYHNHTTFAHKNNMGTPRTFFKFRAKLPWWHNCPAVVYSLSLLHQPINVFWLDTDLAKRHHMNQSGQKYFIIILSFTKSVFNSLWPCGTIWRHWSKSPMVHVHGLLPRQHQAIIWTTDDSSMKFSGIHLVQVRVHSRSQPLNEIKNIV